MALKTAWLLPAAAMVVAAIASCSSDDTDPAAPAGDDDDNTSSSSGKTSSSSGSSSSSSSSSGEPSPVTTTDESYEFNGGTAHYLLMKPTSYDASKKYPLVLNLHGNPGDPRAQQGAMPFETVTKQDAIVAYPQATNGSDWQFQPPKDGNPDMTMMKAIVDEIASKVSIDTTRVLAFGYSGGAYFLSQYACRVTGPFKMVALVSGGAPEPHDGEDENQCVPCKATPIPIFIAHGENDTSEVPFGGGDYARRCYAATNGCNEDDLSEATAPCKTYNGCTQPVTWCPVPNQDHGPWQPAMKQAWDIFNALP